MARFYYAARSNGTLHTVAFSAGTAVAGTDQVLSGPGIDGVDWRARGMFTFGSITKPTAAFTVSCTLLVCSFDATGSTPPSGLTYAWDFGDSSTGSGATPTHTYTSPGSVTVTLTVTDGLGQTATAVHAASPTAGPLPTASFTDSCTLLACTFDGTGSTGPTGGIASYAWDFGDKTTGTGPTPAHTYASPGTYQVTLTVTDGASQTNSTSQQLFVAAQTIAFVDSAASSATASTQTLTIPSDVSSGNGLILIATSASASPATVPAGWTLAGTSTTAGGILTTGVWTKVATTTDPGAQVQVGFGSSVANSVQLLAYSGTSTANPVQAFASANNRTPQTTETTPPLTLSAPRWVLSAWQVKTTNGTTLSVPTGQSARSTTMGTAGGHTGGLVTDSGALVPAGTYGGLVSTLDGSAGAATTWSLILAPAS